MTIESVTYISDLNASYPAAGDQKSEGDDHLRNIKTALKTTFPNVTGAVTATHSQINSLVGGSFPNLTTGNLTTTGNTILGDATADTLNVGNGGIVKDSSGNVGFNCTPTAGVPFRTQGPGNNDVGLEWQRNSSTTGTLLSYDRNLGSFCALQLGVSRFDLGIGTSTGAIAVTSTGVGIGKTPTTKLDVNGTVTATAFSGALSGNISQFTNDSGYITSSGAAAAGSLTGTTLAANVVNSQLTSVGNLSSLTVTSPIVGSVTGSSGSCTGNASTATTASSVAWANVSGVLVSTVTNFTGSDAGAGSYMTDVTLTKVGNTLTLTVARTYHLGGGGGGP